VDPASLKPRKRPGQLRARETVDRILDAAAHIFESKGYPATTTNEIAAVAGISIGSLYQYYPNKDAIIVGLAERHIRSIGDQFRSQLDELRLLRLPIAEVVGALLAGSVELTGSSALHALLLSGCPRTPELDDQLRRFEDGVSAGIAEVLRDANVASGDLALLARLLFVAADAALHQVVLPLKSASERAAAIDELARLLSHGLAVRGEIVG
jgi:AcrR family transcriptional regulator